MVYGFNNSHSALTRDRGQKAKRIDGQHNAVYEPMNWRS